MSFQIFLVQEFLNLHLFLNVVKTVLEGRSFGPPSPPVKSLDGTCEMCKACFSPIYYNIIK